VSENNSDAGTNVEPGQEQPTQTGDEVAPRLASEPSAEVDPRKFLLMVTENDAVQHSKKLQIVASGIDELFDKVAEGLGIDEPVFVCPVASSVDEAIPFESLDDVADKVKVSVWPARCFGTDFEGTDGNDAVDLNTATAVTAVPEGIPPLAGGDDFDHQTEEFGHIDEGFSELLMAEAQAAADEEAEVQRRAEAAARAQAEADAHAAEQARVAADAKAAEVARVAAEQEAAARAQEAEAQAAEQARVVAAAKAAELEERARAEAEAQAAAQAKAAAAAKAAALETTAAEHEELEEAELADARNFILMVVQNDVISKTLLRAQARSLRELRTEISKGMQCVHSQQRACA
jgi:hypothetical protein